MRQEGFEHVAVDRAFAIARGHRSRGQALGDGPALPSRVGVAQPVPGQALALIEDRLSGEKDLHGSTIGTSGNSPSDRAASGWRPALAPIHMGRLSGTT